MTNWLFDRQVILKSPSYQDGLSHEIEYLIRAEGVKFIMDCGNNMGL